MPARTVRRKDRVGLSHASLLVELLLMKYGIDANEFADEQHYGSNANDDKTNQLFAAPDFEPTANVAVVNQTTFDWYQPIEVPA